MTSEQIAQFPCIPKFFGIPVYDADGWPARREYIQWHDGETLEEKWIKHLHCKTSNLPVNEENERLLVQWVFYYLNAPIWRINPFDDGLTVQQLLQSLQADISLDDLIARCMDIGIDPL